MTIKKILFLCTGNSCRSQMAEGWARKLLPGTSMVWSAGIETHGLNPLAVQVMGEVGVNISGHTTKLIADFSEQEFDLVVTVCGHANEQCPVFPGQTKVIHHGFDDPPQLAAGETSNERILGHYRRVRDEIRDFVKNLLEIE